MSENTNRAYAGELSSAEAWRALEERRDALLVDVRTRAEWSYVGVPRIDDLGREVILVEWQGFPGIDRSSDFAERLSGELSTRGAGADTPLYFICRSGARSRSAAIAMTAVGYRQCFNVSDGFEGPLDADAHRGTTRGWKASGLPWSQS